MKDSFSNYHPFVNFIYFTVVILFSMFFMHPVFLIISFICSISYSIYLNGIKAIKFHFIYMLPLLLIVAVINPIFNHEGVTVLFYLNDNPVTLEAVTFGLANAVMFISVIIWFSCYNVIMTSDKFIYLFGKIIPAFSLILSMTLRLVPRFKSQIKVITNAQKCIGKDPSSGNLINRVKNSMNVISILITWALENAIETADSMKSRGYGLKGRTSFSHYQFEMRDRIVIEFMISLIILMIIGVITGENQINYFPEISMNQISVFSIILYIGYAILLLIPIIVNVMEDIKWYHMKLKI